MSTKKSTGTTETDKSNLICLVHTQAMTGRSDPVCIECWYDEIRQVEHGRYSYLAASYIDRDDCMDENLVTVEEFEKGYE